MAIYSLSTFGGAGWQFFDDNGVPLVGGKIYTYEAGTTTPAITYQTSSGTAHSNPIILNAAGRVPTGEIWVAKNVDYKFVLKTAADVTILTVDNLYGMGFIPESVENFTGDGTEIDFTLANAPSDELTIFVYINGVYQQKNTYSLSGVTLTFSEAPPVTSTIEVLYF